MKFQDTFALGIKGIREKKVRAALTILMVVVGVASIIALVSQTAGIQNSITSSLQSLGPTTIIMSPGFSGGRVYQLTDADVASIGSLPNVQSVTPIINVQVTLQTGAQPTSLSIVGISNQGLQDLFGTLKLVDGATFPDANVPVALVGYNVAYPNTSPPQTITVGQPLIIQQSLRSGSKTQTLTAGGILQPYGSTAIVPLDNSIFLSLPAVETMFNRHEYSVLLIKATNVDAVTGVAQSLTNIYGSNAQITTLQQISDTVAAITGQIGILLGSIAGISLTVAGIGIMNIMLVSVFERTHEIGIMKAIGFRNRDVLMLFLVEALAIGLIGGITGLAVGTAFSYALPGFFSSFGSSGGSSSRSTTVRVGTGGGGFGAPGGGGGFGGGPGSAGFPSYTPVVSPELMLVAITVSAVIAVIAGLYPAWKAARMDPITALRYE